MNALPHPLAGPTPPPEVDALVIGAGPVGLFHVFELGLLGVAATLIDAWPRPGGQCAALYADKPIYDLPGLPQLRAGDLVERLWQQIQPFAPQVHWGQVVSTLQARPDGRWQVGCPSGLQWHARSVSIAAGVGAFLPRPLNLPGAEAALASGLIYYPGVDPAHAPTHTPAPAPLPHSDQPVLVLGGDAQALAHAIARAQADAAPPVALMHRRAQLALDPSNPAEAAAAAQWAALCATGRARQLTGQPIALHPAAPGAAPVQLEWMDAGGQTQHWSGARIAVCLGLNPSLGPISGWGLGLARKQIAVDPARMATALPGVYALGDVAHYSGKRRLLVSGFHEATQAAWAVAEQLGRPEVNGPLLYTSSSHLLQQRLGVASA